MARRTLLVLLLGAIAAVVAAGSARADANFYLVLGPNPDGVANAAACSPYPSVPGGFTCPTLRDAVAAADAHAGEDVVYLQAGTYQLNSVISLTTDIEVAGGNARTTTITAPSGDRAFAVTAGVNAILYGLTITGADAGDGDGGAVNTAGNTTLAFVHIANSAADRGGAVSNSGSLLVSNSLLEGNRTPVSPALGGGIFNDVGGTVEVTNSTITANSATDGAGIYSMQGASLNLLETTVAYNNAGGGVGGVNASGSWQSDGSLFVGNIDDGSPGSNCNSTPTGAFNFEDNDSCGVTTSGGIGLEATLTDHGGQTDVLAIPSTSTATGGVTSCPTNEDQRQAPRTAGGACDPGAYQEGANAPPVAAFPIPTVTPSPTPSPTPTATPTPTPTPVPGKSVVGQPVKGSVKIKLPGTNRFITLSGAQSIPVGATVDTRHGTVQIAALQKPGGKLETATFFAGLFKLTQTRTTTDLTLNEALARCPKRRAAHASAAAKKPKTRRLWGSGHGSFRTKGQYSAATVRGTKWLVEDSCAGTLTRVAHGVVSVRDNVRHKTVTLRAGKKYLARPRR
jgi:hypothetical protein